MFLILIHKFREPSPIFVFYHYHAWSVPYNFPVDKVDFSEIYANVDISATQALFVMKFSPYTLKIKQIAIKFKSFSNLIPIRKNLPPNLNIDLITLLLLSVEHVSNLTYLWPLTPNRRSDKEITVDTFWWTNISKCPRWLLCPTYGYRVKGHKSSNYKTCSNDKTSTVNMLVVVRFWKCLRGPLRPTHGYGVKGHKGQIFKACSNDKTSTGQTLKNVDHHAGAF